MATKENSAGSHQCNTLSTTFWGAAVASCLILYTLYWTLYMSPQPGGMIHGAIHWAQAWVHLDEKLMFSPEDMGNRYDDICDLHDPDEEPLAAVRVEFSSTNTIVYGWPSTGGVWVHENCLGVELDFLGLSRFEASPTARFSKAEDDFCERLERIGARFYQSESAYRKASSHLDHSQIWYGWSGSVSGSGVWVLKLDGVDAASLGTSRIKNALTMQERCNAIKMLSGTFYHSWEDVVANGLRGSVGTMDHR